MKPVERMTLNDVDAFVQNLSTRLATRTVADTCSSLRAFLRFLHITGKLSADLAGAVMAPRYRIDEQDRKSTRLNSSHSQISYAVFCLKKKKQTKLPIHYTNTYLHPPRTHRTHA